MYIVADRAESRLYGTSIHATLLFMFHILLMCFSSAAGFLSESESERLPGDIRPDYARDQYLLASRVDLEVAAHESNKRQFINSSAISVQTSTQLCNFCLLQSLFFKLKLQIAADNAPLANPRSQCSSPISPHIYRPTSDELVCTVQTIKLSPPDKYPAQRIQHLHLTTVGATENAEITSNSFPQSPARYHHNREQEHHKTANTRHEGAEFGEEIMRWVQEREKEGREIRVYHLQ